jgi:hypothetical protein
MLCPGEHQQTNTGSNYAATRFDYVDPVSRRFIVNVAGMANVSDSPHTTAT